MTKTHRKDKKYAIQIKSLTKSFKIPLEASNGIKQKLINTLKGIKGYRVFTPLNDISFEVEEGDFFGIVGRNGSGKSTLLKTIAGIYPPDKGQVKVNGSLVPFIELGVGFNPELTGRENVYLNGALLGFSHSEMEKMYNEIVEFAELEEFMDEKLKNYSSGMQVRLAFSIAIQAKGDILLLDEVLAVGDEAFQRKCFNYFAELKREKKTVVLVTHNMESVKQFCTKAMIIESNSKITVGLPAEISEQYKEINHSNIEKIKKSIFKEEDVNVDVDYKTTPDNITFKIKFETKMPLLDAVLTLSIVKNDGETVYRWASDDDTNKGFTLEDGGEGKLKLIIDNIFPDGKYDVSIGLKKRDRTNEYFMLNNAVVFEIGGKGAHWRINTIDKLSMRAYEN